MHVEIVTFWQRDAIPIIFAAKMGRFGGHNLFDVNCYDLGPKPFGLDACEQTFELHLSEHVAFPGDDLRIE